MITLFDSTYRLPSPTWVVSDLDGTIVPDGGCDFTGEWIEAVNQSTFPISLSTGRGLADALPLIEQMPPQFHFVSGGSVVIKPDLTSEIMLPLSEEQIDAVESLVRLYEPEEYKYMKEGRWSSQRGTRCDAIPVISLNFGTDELKALAVKNAAEKLSFALSAVVTTDTKKFYVHMSPLGSDKGYAVKFVRSQHRKESSPVIVGFGDQRNDISLLKACTAGFMVEDGCFELRDHSIGSILPPKNDGAAKALQVLSTIK